MIKLLAKNQKGGRYYFYEDDESVYYIKSPLARAEKEYVDSLPVFIRKGFDSDLTFEEREFRNLEDLREFAILDCSSRESSATEERQESAEDLLIFAPIEIVVEYLEIIEDMINRREFVGLDLIFRQLSQNYEMLENEDLANKKNELKIAFDRARFTCVEDMRVANLVTKRIQRERSVLSFAV